MINAQTNVVKDGSSDTSVFTIKAELIEEGVIIKSVKDETTGVGVLGRGIRVTAVQQLLHKEVQQLTASCSAHRRVPALQRPEA